MKWSVHFTQHCSVHWKRSTDFHPAPIACRTQSKATESKVIKKKHIVYLFSTLVVDSVVLFELTACSFPPEPSKNRRPQSTAPSTRLSHKLVVRSHLAHFQPEGGIFTPLSSCFRLKACLERQHYRSTDLLNNVLPSYFVA